MLGGLIRIPERLWEWTGLVKIFVEGGEIGQNFVMTGGIGQNSCKSGHNWSGFLWEWVRLAIVSMRMHRIGQNSYESG